MVIARSLVILTINVIIYAVFFISAKYFSNYTGTFFDQNPWIVIGIFTFVHPVNKLSIWLVFEFIDKFLTFLMSLDKRTPETNPILRGNFASCDSESKSYEVLKVLDGKIPSDINGVFLRNGPNFKNMNDSKMVHWFDGDSMIHAFRIKDGKIYYCSKYTDTPRIQMETKLGKGIYPRIGEMTTIPGIMKVGLYAVQ